MNHLGILYTFAGASLAQAQSSNTGTSSLTSLPQGPSVIANSEKAKDAIGMTSWGMAIILIVIAVALVVVGAISLHNQKIGRFFCCLGAIVFLAMGTFFRGWIGV
ncbi:hypothetical protein [Halobacteriovorax sp. ZH2_bin.1]|uniref:hypothetical protein n=1 Tax=unclassified Halobacteriovorax TaxID=2639665 RepID=UPI00371706F9